MAIVKMKKLTLVGLLKDKQPIFDLVAASGCVHVVETQKFENCSTSDTERQRALLTSQMQRVEAAAKFVRMGVDEFNNQHKKDNQAIDISKPSMSRPLYELTFEQLLDYRARQDQLMQTVEDIEQLKRLLENRAQEIQKISTELENVAIFSKLPNPTTFYTDTKSTAIMLGTVSPYNVGKLTEAVSEFDMAELTVVDTYKGNTLVSVVVHKSQASLLEKLQQLGLTPSTVKIDILPSQYILQLQQQKQDLEGGIDSFKPQLDEFASTVVDLESFHDYLNFELNKIDADGALQQTGRTFILQGFVPEEKQQQLLASLGDYVDKTEISFDQVSTDEQVPILHKNNKIVKNFEQVTNMYMPPSYHEIDPNPVMSIFYTIIFGFMLGDVGYGLLLILAGLLSKIFIKQETGIKKLLGLLGVCGWGGVVIGSLYGSFFGFAALSDWFGIEPLLPDPGAFPKTTMVISLLFGCFHLIAAYLMDMAKKLKRREVVTAFGVSMMWSVFFASAFAAVLQAALQFCDHQNFNTIVIPQIVSQVGIIGLLASLVIIMFFSGHKKSIGGRFASAFGSVYGLLNIFGDIISYVRIFGLMLSGVMMAVVTNQLSGMVMQNGIVGIIFGVILFVLVHVFNIAISVLGIYIHDGRLQYIEFYGKFYEGDGKLFVPFGREFKHTLIIPNQVKK